MWWEDEDSAMMNMKIKSDEWTGQVQGSMYDLIQAIEKG